MAKAIASNIDANFLKVVSSAIVDKYIGESARLIREMFGYARSHEPCIIFMDEIDAIGGKRFSEGTSADREIQRTLMELLNQLDGFDVLAGTRATTPYPTSAARPFTQQPIERERAAFTRQTLVWKGAVRASTQARVDPWNKTIYKRVDLTTQCGK